MLYKYKNGTLEVQGISFSKGEYQFKGSEIDRSLSYGKISKTIADRVQEQQAQQQKAKMAQPKSLADELREIIEQSDNKSAQETHYLKQEPQTQYLKQEPQTNYLRTPTHQVLKLIYRMM